MPKRVLTFLYRNQIGLVIAMSGFVFAFVCVNSAIGQVSDSELNQRVRDAAANREAMTASQNAPKLDIDYFDLMIKGGQWLSCPVVRQQHNECQNESNTDKPAQ